MKISLLTDIGQKRSSNQDFINKFDNKAGIPLVVLADGMGGHRAGNIASEFTVTEFGRAWIETDLKEPQLIYDWLALMVQDINQKVYALGQADEYKGMGTTVEAAALLADTLVYAHVGDSRISLLREGNFEQLTSDHSLVNALVEAGQLTPEEAEKHPQKNIITQSIGQESPVDPDLAMITLQKDDLLLLNSDGLTNMVSLEAIKEVLQSDQELEEKAALLVSAANQAGGLDNITVALILVESEGS